MDDRAGIGCAREAVFVGEGGLEIALDINARLRTPEREKLSLRAAPSQTVSLVKSHVTILFWNLCSTNASALDHSNGTVPVGLSSVASTTDWLWGSAGEGPIAVVIM